MQHAATAYEEQSAADVEGRDEGQTSVTAELEAWIDVMNVSAHTWRNDALADLDFGIVRRHGGESKVLWVEGGGGWF